MITRSHQSWAVGETVNVGFMRLRVVRIRLTPGDFKPDAYELVGLGKSADRRYEFVPHFGLTRIH